MLRNHACGSREHVQTRRQMLGSLLGTTAAVSAGLSTGLLTEGLPETLFAQQVQPTKKRVLFLWLDGGMSQFESWDPKPESPFGGPFRPIQTPVAGVHVSELMPQMAQRLDRFSLVRSMHTRFEDHSRGVVPIQQGDPKNRGVTYPFFGSACIKLLEAENGALPPYIHIKPGSGGFMFQDAGFLGAKYGALALGDGKAPPNLIAPTPQLETRQNARRQLRQTFDARFGRQRVTEQHSAYQHTYHVAEQMAKNAALFDPARLKPEDVARYGNSEFGRHVLQARMLLEAGVTFAKVTMFHWDTHGDNFNCHLDGVSIVDNALAAVIDDLIDRGMYDNTLVILLSEFGRTPKINGRVGRDHWPECWSVGFGGGGIRPGVVVGKTNAAGTFNEGDEYDIGHLFHTFFKALGIDPQVSEYDNNGQPLPIAHEGYGPIQALLA